MLSKHFFFWQHYMLNSEINDQLAAAAAIQEGDVVLEVGPGTGSLTNVLLNAGATVLAIEKVTISLQIVIVYSYDYEFNAHEFRSHELQDQHMVGLVRERFTSTDQLEVNCTCICSSWCLL